MHLKITGLLGTEAAGDAGGTTGDASGGELRTNTGLTDGASIKGDAKQAIGAGDGLGECSEFLTAFLVKAQRHLPARAALLLLTSCIDQVGARQGRLIKQRRDARFGLVEQGLQLFDLAGPWRQAQAGLLDRVSERAAVVDRIVSISRTITTFQLIEPGVDQALEALQAHQLLAGAWLLGAELEHRRGAQHLSGTARILHTRQLDHNAIGAGGGHRGF